MSLVLSPKTGRLVKVGGKAFNDLLEDPKYRDTLFLPTSPRSNKNNTLPSLSSLKPSLGPSPQGLSSLAPPPVSPRLTSPSSSLSEVRMPVLPPLVPALSTFPKSSSSLPEIKLPEINRLPHLNSNTLPDLKNSNRLPGINSNNSNTLPNLKNSNKQNSLPKLGKFNPIPTLEETLATTKQPAKRAQISEMIEEQREQEGRGIKTRGWAARSPTRGKERHQLKEECGNKCFLLPEQEKFPICASPRTTGGTSNCLTDCQGLQASYIRAKQWGYEDVAQKADQLLQQCNKEGLKNFVPGELPKLSKASSLPPISPLPSLRLAGTMDRTEGQGENYGFVRRNVRRSVLFNHEEIPEETEEYGWHKHDDRHHGHSDRHHGHSDRHHYSEEREKDVLGKYDNYPNISKSLTRYGTLNRNYASPNEEIQADDEEEERREEGVEESRENYTSQRRFPKSLPPLNLYGTTMDDKKPGCGCGNAK